MFYILGLLFILHIAVPCFSIGAMCRRGSKAKVNSPISPDEVDPMRWNTNGLHSTGIEPF
jgi:hypothetical protein